MWISRVSGSPTVTGPSTALLGRWRSFFSIRQVGLWIRFQVSIFDVEFPRKLERRHKEVAAHLTLTYFWPHSVAKENVHLTLRRIDGEHDRRACICSVVVRFLVEINLG